MHSFRGKLLIIFTSLLGLTLGATSFFVITGTYRSIENNAEQELNVALAVFQELLDERGTRLRESNLILTTDFALKDAIATEEDETILSVLANHGDRINADMIIMLDTEGQTVFSTHEEVFDPDSLQRLMAPGDSGATILTLAEGEPFQLVLAPVRAPEDIIAWVGMGFALNQQLTADLKQITTTDITLIYRDQFNPLPSWVTTISEQNISFHEVEYSNLPPTDLEPRSSAFELFERFVEEIKFTLSDNDHLATAHMLIDRDDSQLVAILSTSLQQEFLPYKNLRLQLFAIFVIALAIAIVATYFVARSVTQPIESLVIAAKRIAKGDYRQTIRVPGKNELGLLGQTLNIMQGAINQREEHIIYQAQHDLLTKLPNREYIRSEIKQRLQQDLSQSSNALCILQFRNLNQLSDVYGTDVKDQLLVLIADRLRSCVGKFDLVARIASNEFLIFFNKASSDNLAILQNSIFSAMEGSYHTGEIDVQVDIKAGISFCPEHGDSFDDLLRRAYIAISKSRQTENQLAVYQEGEDATHLRKINITSRLQDAIRNDGFNLVFHPQLEVKSNAITQCEVLIRWNDEELGPVFPDEFIPLAEHSGDILEITRWVFDQSIQQLQLWKTKNISLGLCINLSARDILSNELVEHVLAKISDTEIDSKQVILEITETAMVEDPKQAIANLQKLNAAGFHLAMDDFGTGFSSLSQLKSMPIHELKIDKSFILNIENDTDDQKIVKAAIEMAHSLNLRVVAEGVETQPAFDYLKNIGCDIVQGYYLTKPIACDDLESWLASTSDKLHLQTS